MLFDKNEYKYCRFCQKADDFCDGKVLCSAKGPVDADYCCHRFKYDPTRREPSLPAAVKIPVSAGAFDL